MQIFIPTMGRPHDQLTFAKLQGAGHNPFLVVPTSETKTYNALYAGSVIPTRARGIADTRQFILEYARRLGFEHIAMMDDDLNFFYRRKDEPEKFAMCTPAKIRELLNRIDRELLSFAHVSVMAREGANRVTDAHRDVSRPLRIYAYDVPRVMASGARYHSGLVQDDFDMTLQLLRKGLPNRVIADFVHNQRSSHAPGGASCYRTIESHNASVRVLADLHAPFVRVVEKPPLKSGGWDGQPRLDCVIAWKKAYEEGLNNARK